MQALDLVHPVSDTFQKLVEPFFRDYLFRCMEDQQRIGRDVVVDLRVPQQVSGNSSEMHRTRDSRR